jgi:hypothetical protein
VWHAHVVRTPPARITGGEGGRAEGPQAVALLADAVLGRGREVLVAVDGQGPRGARDVDRAMARRVWPRARVEVAREEAIVAAVVCGDGGKDGLAADGVERVPAPVLRPLLKLRFLTFAEQDQPRLVEGVAVEFRTDYWVGSASSPSCRPTLRRSGATHRPR